jgi:RIO kinase 2
MLEFLTENVSHVLSSAQVAAKAIRELEPEDWAVLHAMEKSMRDHESVTVKQIQTESHLHQDQVEFRLGSLNYDGFVMSSKFGYILNTAGLDALALNSLVKRNLISGMGKAIGMGKESDVYEVISESGRQMVIKFYRIGRISFRSTRRMRAYTSPQNQHQWLEINIATTEREAEGLKRASEASIDVPELITRDRHAVLMSEIQGSMLYKVDPDDIKNPKKLLRAILQDVRKAYSADMINGDISEFNIMFDGERPWIIDWPQFVSLTHVNASEMLQRDIRNSISYFERKFGLKLSRENVLKYVKGEKSRLEIS